jgi:hypothetical protein
MITFCVTSKKESAAGEMYALLIQRSIDKKKGKFTVSHFVLVSSTSL